MELDDAYANAAHIPHAAGYPPRWREAARRFAAGLGEGRVRIGLPYGPRTREVFDLFLPDATPVGLVVFVHGGYWREFDASWWWHLAQGPCERGWAVAMPTYELCPAVTISAIVAEIASAVRAAAAQVPGPISLTGHSAGGHLVARMLAPGMLEHRIVARLHHVAPISPLADLRPLIMTSMNADLQLDLDSARLQSPVFQPVPLVPVSIWVGEDERPVFLDQARWLADAWGAERVIVQGRHHFDVIDALADPQSALVARLTR